MVKRIDPNNWDNLVNNNDNKYKKYIQIQSAFKLSLFDFRILMGYFLPISTPALKRLY